jgi:hypothetical protein
LLSFSFEHRGGFNQSEPTETWIFVTPPLAREESGGGVLNAVRFGSKWLLPFFAYSCF